MTDPEHYASFEFDGDLGVAVFNRRCPKCGRWVSIRNSQCETDGDSVTTCIVSCSRCGAVRLEFEGWFSKEECLP